MLKTSLRFGRAILGMAFLFWGCEKENGALGLDQVIEGKPELGVLKSFPVIATTVRADSVLTNNPTRMMVGRFQDPSFGTANYELATQFLLEKVAPDFGENPVCDSAFLVLHMNGVYGDSTLPVTLEVLELTQALFRDTAYYSTGSIASGTVLGQSTFVPSPGKTIYYQGDTLRQRVIVPLDPAFFQDKVISPSRVGQQYMLTNTDFVQHFKGLHLRVTNAQGAVMFIEPLSNITKVDLFYSNVTDTGKFSLIINSSATWYHTAEFDYSTAEFDLANQDTAIGMPLNYIQTMGGVTTELRIPGLDAFLDSGFIVNKAELTLPVLPGSKGTLTPPQLLILRQRLDDGSLEPIVDYRSTEGTRVGGGINYGPYRKANYRFNITRHIFQVMNGQTENRTLVLEPTRQEYTPYRVILNGLPDPNLPMRLDIFYAKVKNP
jgi:hypothetical protein